MIVDYPEQCAIGQMILESNDSDTVIGFVSLANDVTGVCEVVLFEPTELELDDGVEFLSESVPDWEELFKTALDEAPTEVQQMWKDTVIRQVNDQTEPNS